MGVIPDERTGVAVSDEESNLVKHAKYELSLISEDPEFIEYYLKMIRLFSDMGHSGGSASVFIPTLSALLQFKNLTPLTSNPDEWQHLTYEVWPDPQAIWQNLRNGEAFSKDGGKTYYILSEKTIEGNPIMRTSEVYGEEEI